MPALSDFIILLCFYFIFIFHRPNLLPEIVDRIQAWKEAIELKSYPVNPFVSGQIVPDDQAE